MQNNDLKLLKILNDKHVPFEVYFQVMEWANEASRLEYNFKPSRKHRKSQLRHLEKITNAITVRPNQLSVLLSGPPRRNVQITVYDFKFLWKLGR